MATIGTLAVNIVATTDKFIAGLNNAKGALGKFAKGISSVQGIIGGLAVAGLGAIVTSAIEAAGAVQALTSRLNISAEAITALHYAAEQLESSAGAVDTGLSKMVVTLGKATMGAKVAQKAFSDIGLKWQSLSELPVEQQFLSIVGALNKITDVNQRAAAAQAIFGKGAKELLPLINAGADAIIRQGQAAADAGAIMGTKTVDALDKTGDSIKSLSDGWGVMKANAVAAFAPILDSLVFIANHVTKVFAAIVTSVKITLSAILAVILKGIALAIDGINLLLPKSLEIGNSFHAQAGGVVGQISEDAKGIAGKKANPLAADNTGGKLDQQTVLLQRIADGQKLTLGGVR